MECSPVERTRPSTAASTAAARHAAGSEASRRPSEARSERNANGGARDTRPQRRDRFSGLDRVARSRSDAPSLILLWTCASVPVFGAIGCIIVCTVAVMIVITAIDIGGATDIAINIGARRTLPASVARP